MYHKSHVRFVNTHTKCYCGNNDIHLLIQECILIGRARGSIHSGMVRQRFYIVHNKHFGKFLHLLTAEAIYYARLTFHAFDKLYNVLIYRCGFRAYFVIQILTIERRFEYIRVEHTEILLYIMLYLRSGSSSKRYHRTLADFAYYRAYSSVFRTEVMPPLRYTVSFIHGVKRYLDRFKELYILIFGQRFRCHIKQFGFPGDDVTLHLVYRRFVK